MKTDKKTILLVEDEIFIAMREKLELKQKGYTVHHVFKGEDAVKTALEPDSPIDLILMDINLGSGIDGTKAAEEILKCKDIPVVFLSSHTEPEVVENTEKITSYGYVVKNSGIIALNASIKMAFKLFEARMREKEQRKALSISEETYRNIFCNAQVGLFRTDIRTGQILDANDAVARFIGYKDREELLAKPFNIAERYVDPDDRKKIISLLKAHGEFKNFETRFRRNDNSIIWVQFSAKLVPEKDWMEGVSEDITNRKKAELELIKAKEKTEESEARFKALHNASFGGISIHDKGIILECNQGLADITGYLTDELIGMNGLLLIAEQSRDFVMKKILSGYEKPYEAMGLRKNGEEFPMRLEARNIPYKGKQMRVVEFRDITEYKRTEKALKESEEKHRALIENLSDMILILDKDGRNVWNSPAVRQYGMEPEDSIGRPFDEYTHPDDLEKVRQQWDEMIANPGVNYTSEQRASGTPEDPETWIYQHSTFVYLPDVPGINGVVSVCRNITEQKRAEIALRKSEEKYRILVEGS
ncbi:PAS domain S-box protein, partial [Desulfococcaceae bacterium HSG9]|nr:PAS domain S-box protein [Desulfococcaceae bacterium HSG9]